MCFVGDKVRLTIWGQSNFYSFNIIEFIEQNGKTVEFKIETNTLYEWFLLITT